MIVPEYIVFYDGECGFCNRTVNFILKNEKDEEIYFAKIQSEFTKNLFDLKQFPLPDLSTFYFYCEGRLFERSAAALKVSQRLRFPTNLLTGFIIIPRPLRDWGYDQIAKRRRKLFKSYCILPNAEQQKRFLD